MTSILYKTSAVIGTAAAAWVGTSLAYGESPVASAQRTGLMAVRATRDISAVLTMVSGTTLESPAVLSSQEGRATCSSALRSGEVPSSASRPQEKQILVRT